MPENVAGFAGVVLDQVRAAIREADLLVFMVDGKAGPHPVDQQIAEMLRTADRRVLLVVNKLDKLPDETAQHEFWELGLGEPVPVSSAAGKGSGDLLDRIVELLPEITEEEKAEELLYVAVVGKPNVGKSSFINRLLGEERLVVSEV